MPCKERVRLVIEDPGTGRLEVEAVLHPRGCMGARSTHLDIPLRGPLEGSLLASLAGPRGGLTLRARPASGGCVELEAPSGLPPVRLCVEGAVLGGGLAYLRRVRGKLYLTLPGLAGRRA